MGSRPLKHLGVHPQPRRSGRCGGYAHVESLWIYRIPLVGEYSAQIYRIVNDAWERLPALWKQGCWVQLRFSFLPDNPRLTQPGDDGYAGEGGPTIKYNVNQGTSRAPDYTMHQVDLCAKSYNNHQNTQLARQPGFTFREPHTSRKGRLIRSKPELILATANHI